MRSCSGRGIGADEFFGLPPSDRNRADTALFLALSATDSRVHANNEGFVVSWLPPNKHGVKVGEKVARMVVHFASTIFWTVVDNERENVPRMLLLTERIGIILTTNKLATND